MSSAFLGEVEEPMRETLEAGRSIVRSHGCTRFHFIRPAQSDNSVHDGMHGETEVLMGRMK